MKVRDIYIIYYISIFPVLIDEIRNLFRVLIVDLDTRYVIVKQSNLTRSSRGVQKLRKC